MEEETILSEIEHVVGPNGEPVVLTPAKQKTEGDISAQTSNYETAISCSVLITLFLIVLGFTFIGIAAVHGVNLLFKLGGWTFFIAFLSVFAPVPCCLKMKKHQEIRSQKFIYRDGVENNTMQAMD